jgi:NAD(P)-dependent dehydrogenase (short-subunit alcohol dehydrogenase family)
MRTSTSTGTDRKSISYRQASGQKRGLEFAFGNGLLRMKLLASWNQNNFPPISAIIYNAFTWTLGGQSFSNNHYESTFQVSHLAHFFLVLKLLRNMDHDSGRIIMLSSEVHDPEVRIPLSKLGAELPSDENLDLLVKPGPDEAGTEHDMGWHRYANSNQRHVHAEFKLSTPTGTR